MSYISSGGGAGGGVTSFSGDGTFITNAASTGAVTTTLGTLPVANGGAGVLSTANDGLFIPIESVASLTAAGTSATLTANHTRAVQFNLSRTITFTKMTINVVATVNTQNYFVSIMNRAGNTKLVQGQFALTASTGGYTATVSQTTLNPGGYWMMWGCDSATPTVTAWGNLQAAAIVIFNKNANRIGDSDQLIVGTTMPAGIGTVTGANTNFPIVLLEP